MLLTPEDGSKDVGQFIKDSPRKAVAILAAFVVMFVFLFWQPNVPVVDNLARKMVDTLSGKPNIEGVWLAQGGWSQPKSITFHSDRTGSMNWGIFGVDHFSNWSVDGDRIIMTCEKEGRVGFDYRLEGETLIVNLTDEQWLFRRNK